MKNIFTVLLIISIIAIEYLATTTMQIKPIQNSWDKLNHFIAFFTLYILFYFSNFNITKKQMVILLFLFALQIEVVQYFIPNREFSLLDIFADLVGVFIGMVVLEYLKKLKVQLF